MARVGQAASLLHHPRQVLVNYVQLLVQLAQFLEFVAAVRPTTHRPPRPVRRSNVKTAAKLRRTYLVLFRAIELQKVVQNRQLYFAFFRFQLALPVHQRCQQHVNVGHAEMVLAEGVLQLHHGRHGRLRQRRRLGDKPVH